MSALDPNTIAADFFNDVLKAVPTSNTPTDDVMTVVYDLNAPLGKNFWIDEDGQVAKQAAVTTSWAAAMQIHVPEEHALREVLLKVGNCPYAALVNAKFPAVPLGAEFRIASRKKITTMFGPDADTDAVHKWENFVLVARVKAQTAPSTWQLIDRDIDAHTPDAMRVGSDKWLNTCDIILPGLANTTRVVMASSSSRVMRDGQPAGAGNGCHFSPYRVQSVFGI